MSSTLGPKRQKILTFSGPVVATVTPFDANGEIALESVPRYLDYLWKIGVKGVYVHGTTGEGVSLNITEKMTLSKRWVEAVRSAKLDMLLIINVSSSCAKDTLTHARLCQELKVDGLAVLPPFYYRPTTPDQLVQYFALVGAEAPDVPLFFYHFPAMTGVDRKFCLLDFYV